MAGQKRTRTGDLKPSSGPQPQQQDTPMTDSPPCAQAPAPTASKPKVARTKATSFNTSHPEYRTAPSPAPKITTSPAAKRNSPPNPNAGPSANNKNKKTRDGGIQKRPPLPANTTLSKRPLLHPALPSPFSSAESPKVLYITASTAFVPACKRVRGLLAQISKRAGQAAAEGRGRGRGSHAQNQRLENRVGGRLEANGHLTPGDVEANIAGTAAAAAKGPGRRGGRGSAKGEEVYLKATGRAIPRALELGVKFQGEEDCYVRVEMGSVKAIDDVIVTSNVDAEGEEKDEEEEDDEVPETRIRTLSTVTVCVGLL